MADGALNATSTDGVNGSQLNATNTRIDNFYAINVAIGSNSTTGTAHDSSSITIGGVKYDFQAAASAASTNVFSVGAVGAERQIQNVAAGLLSATSTDAVNASQLWQVKEAMGAVVTADGQVSVGKFETDRTITARKILNLARGDISSDTSTDAVNGGQLFETNLVLNSILGSRYGLNSGASSLALGVGSVAGMRANPMTHYRATALGVQSQATGLNATALGYNAQATQTDSLALG